MNVKLFMLCFFLHASLYSQHLELVQPVRYLALGDSYTMGIAVDPSQNWPSQLFARLTVSGYNTEKLQIIAQAGWTTDDLATAIREENLQNDFNMVALLIGVNNQYQGVEVDLYEKDFEELLIEAIKLAQGRKEGVFVISIPDYAFTPFGNNQSYISEAIDAYNSANSKIARKHGVTYFDLTFISRLGLENPELVAIDKLHPSPMMYKLWVDKIMDHINTYNTIQYIDDKSQATEEMIIFPNPASDKISIIFSSGEISAKNTLSIFTLSGKLVFRKDDISFHLSEKTNVGLPELNEGFYLVELLSDSRKFVTKLIIKDSR